MANQTSGGNEPEPFTVAMGGKEIPCNRTGNGPIRLVFTQGASGTITSHGVANFSAGFSRSARSSVICFQGNMNLGSRVKMFDAVQDHNIGNHQREKALALGGRSMGARAAVLSATEDTKCLIMASYPLHTDTEVRDKILLDLDADKDVLFISGDRDSMCDLVRLNEVRKKMKARTWLIRVRDADHGMNVRPNKATRIVGEECGALAEQWLVGSREGETDREVWWGKDEDGEEHVFVDTWKGLAKSASKKESKMKPAAKKSKAPKKPEGPRKVSKAVKDTKPALVRTKEGNEKSRISTNRDKDSVGPSTELRRSKRKRVE